MEKTKGAKQAVITGNLNIPAKSDVNNVNYVHKQTIHRENIKNERKFETKNFKHEYTFSPYSCNFYNKKSLSYCG